MKNRDGKIVPGAGFLMKNLKSDGNIKYFEGEGDDEEWEILLLCLKVFNGFL